MLYPQVAAAQWTVDFALGSDTGGASLQLRGLEWIGSGRLPLTLY